MSILMFIDFLFCIDVIYPLKFNDLIFCIDFIPLNLMTCYFVDLATHRLVILLMRQPIELLLTCYFIDPTTHRFIALLFRRSKNH